MENITKIDVCVTNISSYHRNRFGQIRQIDFNLKLQDF